MTGVQTCALPIYGCVRGSIYVINERRAHPLSGVEASYVHTFTLHFSIRFVQLFNSGSLKMFTTGNLKVGQIKVSLLQEIKLASVLR